MMVNHKQDPFSNVISLFLYSLCAFSCMHGATITVTSSADAGAGSFRDALTTASSGDTIQFQSGLGTITLLSSLPAIQTNLTINTQSGTQLIDGNRYQIFDIRPTSITSAGPTVSVSNVSIVNGMAVGGQGAMSTYGGGGGGGAGLGGGYFIKGTLTLSGISVSNCTALGGSGGSVFSLPSPVDGGGGGGGGSFSLVSPDGYSGPMESQNNRRGGSGRGDLAGGGGRGQTGSSGPPCINAAGVSGSTGGGGGGGGAQSSCTGSVGAIGGYGGGGGGGGGGSSAGTIPSGGRGGTGGYGGGGGGAGAFGSGSAKIGGAAGLFGGAGASTTAVGLGGGGGGGGGIGAGIFVYRGSTLIVNSGSTITNGSVVGGAGGTSPAGNGATGATAGSGIFLDQGSTVQFSGPLTVDCSIDSSASFVDNGISVLSNTVQIDGTNTYRGNTRITSATLALNNSSALGLGTATINMNNGTLRWMAASPATVSKTINLTGTCNFNIDTGVTATLSNVLNGGTINLHFLGDGTLTVGGLTANNYITSSNTIIESGTVILSKPNNLDAIRGNIFILGGTLQNAANEQINTNTVIMTSGVYDLHGFSERFNQLTMSGPGGAVLLGQNGTFTIINDPFSMSNGASISGSGSLLLGPFPFGPVLSCVYAGTGAQASISTQTLALNQTNFLFNISQGADSPDLIVSSAISNQQNGIIKQGAGMLQFAGASANTYSGITTISAGTLSLSKQSGVTAIPGSVTINGGILQLDGDDQIANGSTVTLSSGTFFLNGHSDTINGLVTTGGLTDLGSGTLTLSGTGSATLTMGNSTSITGTGTVAFTGTGGGLTYNGATSEATISANMNLGSSNFVFTINRGLASVDMDVSGAISNVSGGLTKSFNGILQFSGSGANTYIGTTTVSLGTLSLNKTPGIDAIPGAVTIDGGILELAANDQIASTSTVTISSGTFNLNNFSDTIGALVMTGGTTTLAGGTLTLTAPSATALSLGDGITIATSGTIALNGAGVGVTYTGTTTHASIDANMNLSADDHPFDVPVGADSPELTISGAIAGGSGSVTKTGGGTLEFLGSSANTYSGTTTVTSGTLLLNKSMNITSIPGDVTINGGTLQLLADNQMAATSTVSISSGTFNLNGVADTILSLIMTGGSTTLGGGTLTLNGSSAIALSLGDGISIGGPGTIAFSSLNGGITYTGTTTHASILADISLSGNNHTLDVPVGADSPELILSGEISGTSASITKINSGTVQFAGTSANTYSGTTTVSAGFLLLNKPAGTNAIAADVVVNGGTLRLAASNQMANASSVSISSGAFDLNSFSETITSLIMTGGSTTLGGGSLNLSGTTSTTLSMGDGNSVISGAGSIVFGGVGGGMTYNGSTDQATISSNIDMGSSNRTFNIGNGSAVIDTLISGNLSGIGASLTKTGAGTMVLSGNNSYTGLTTISAGTLIVSVASLPGTTTNNSHLIFNQTTDGTFSHTISGLGDLTIEGGGLLNLTQPVSQSNNITVGSTGQLALNTQATANLTVNAGGYLQGTGPVIGAVSILGTMSPGNSVGTFTVDGSYTQAAGSTYLIECDPNSADLVSATGLLTIANNTTCSVVPTFGSYSPLYQKVIMTGSSRIGTFTNVTFSLPAFKGEIHYNSTSVLLLMNIEPFQNLPLDSASQVVVRCLDQLFGDETTVLQPVIDELRFMTIGEMEQTMHQMLPTVFNTLDLATEELLVQTEVVISRQMNIASIEGCERHNPIRVWYDLFVASADQDSNGYRVGYKANPWGNLLGCDAKLTDSSLIGGAIGYAEEPLKWKEEGGHARSHNGFAALYSNCYFNPHLYLQGTLVGALTHQNTDRYITFAGDDFPVHTEKAHANMRGISGLAHVELGGAFTSKIHVQRPSLKIDYAYLHRDGFKESGAGPLDLKVKTHNADLLRAEFSLEFLTSFGILNNTSVTTPYLIVGDAYEWRFVGKMETASLAPLSCPMKIAGLFPQRNLYFFEVGLIQGFFCDQAQFSCDYRQEGGYHYLNRTWSGQLRLNF